MLWTLQTPSSPRPPARPPLTLVKDGVGRLVASQGLLGQVLVALGQTLDLGKAGVERHGRVAGVLGHVQVGGSAQLLLDHQCLLQELRGRGQESWLSHPQPAGAQGSRTVTSPPALTLYTPLHSRCRERTQTSCLPASLL